MTSKELLFTGIHARNINLVRKLLEVVLPVTYGEDFYRKLQEGPSELSRLVYYRDIAVGAIGCRVLDGEAAVAVEGGGAATAGAGAAAAGSGSSARKLYITVLAVLGPYRDRGIGSALLRGLLEAVDGGKVKGAEGAEEIYLHVWQENKEAVRVCGLFPFLAPHCNTHDTDSHIHARIHALRTQPSDYVL